MNKSRDGQQAMKEKQAIQTSVKGAREIGTRINEIAEVDLMRQLC
jgi:hypothetical protein